MFFRRAANCEGSAFQEPVGPWPLLKIRCDGKEQKAPRGQRGDDHEKRPGRLPLFGKLFSRGTCPFLDLYEQSGLLSKAAFIKASVQRGVPGGKDRPGTLEYVAKLTAFHAQFRAVGTNYNQVVKELHAHFSEKKTLALLYKLERATRELAAVGQQVVSPSEEVKQRW